jgi:hypothetical protein
VLKGIRLTLMFGPAVPVPAPKVVLDALETVQVTATAAAGAKSGFQLTFVLDNHSPLHTVLLLAAAQTPWLRVLLIVTVNGTPEVLMDGVVTRQEVTPSNEPGFSKLTVTGEDLTAVMDQQEYNGVPYPAMPAEARVALIVAKYAVFGMIPLVIPALFSDAPIPVDKIPAHQGTDLQYVTQLAKDAGYVFYVEPGPAPAVNTAYWGPEVKVGAPQPALSIGMDAHSNVETLSFSFNGVGKTLPIVYVHNALTKAPIPIPVPDIGPLNPPLGLIPPLPKQVEFMNDTAKLSPLAALAKGLARAAGSSEAVSGNGTLDVLRYGHVLKPRRLVGVRGAGLAFDGLYFVKSVTSTLKAGEFKQSFNLTRNGLVSITPAVPV